MWRSTRAASLRLLATSYGIFNIAIVTISLPMLSWSGIVYCTSNAETSPSGDRVARIRVEIATATALKVNLGKQIR
jgi:hypothetical protein